MSDLFPIGLTEMIACAERELSYRRRVYPRRVAAGQMTQELADRETERMTAIIDYLRQQKDRAAGTNP